jgi:PIN domain nuclease of toxin-antitoxin system
VWEIAIERALGRVRAPAPLSAVVDQLGFSRLPITAGDADEPQHCPRITEIRSAACSSPQAARLDPTFVSRDSVLDADGVPILRRSCAAGRVAHYFR